MNSLTEIKQAIDSMESRIEEDVVDLFQQQLSLLGELYTGKTAVISVIKMMQAIGRYLGSKRDNADKGALPALKFIAISLEKLVTPPDLNKEQINQILSECIQSYKALKNKIASQPLVTNAEIQDLKAVILAIDWEISEMTLKTFDTVTRRMLTRLKSHKILHAFLMIIHSMGQYIASKKATAHKDSLFLLRSVFENFERIIQTPGMPLQEKQQLIENDIQAFHNFKRELSSLAENSPVFPDKPVSPDKPVYPDKIDETEDEIIQPALSHVKTSSRPAAQDVVPLSPLSETSFAGQSRDAENITPALAGKKKRVPAPRDIMDDLFSGKESPADELLDAIHLSSVHGPDQQRAMNMEPTKEELQEEGIKNFTPHRKGNEPIPEIGDRLDAFFNLDVSESKIAEAAIENHGPLEAYDGSDVSLADDSPMETIVPFQYEDDVFEETLVEETLVEETLVEETLVEETLVEENLVEENLVEENLDEETLVEENLDEENLDEENLDEENLDEENLDEENLDEENLDEENLDEENSTQITLNRVLSLVKSPDGLLEEDTLTAINQDISHLKTMWLGDSDKTMLVDIISWLLMKNHPPVLTDSKTMEAQTAASIPEQLDNRPSGFWGKIKSILFKSA